MAYPLLSELAQLDGIERQVDLVALSGVDSSTISRQWPNPRWLDEISPANFWKLAAVLSTITDYLADLPESVLVQAAELAVDADLVLVQPRLQELLHDGVDPQHLAKALEAAAGLVRAGDSDDMLLAQTTNMSVFWEQRRGRALSMVLDIERPLLADPDAVLAPGQRLLELLVSKPITTGRTETDDRARQAMHHYFGSDEPTPALNIPANRALDLRCEITRRLNAENDFGLIDYYARRLESEPHPSVVEDWMFPAWCGDITVGSGPVRLRRGSVRLARTGQELIYEFGNNRYSPAYLGYVSTVYLPRAVDLDPTLGGKRSEIADAMLHRVKNDSRCDFLEAAAGDLQTV